jgi:mannitol/fructose-specific phosphotransferase system IIA component (Ntr-type)
VHLQLLSQLATMFSDAQLRQSLRAAESPEHILQILEGWAERPPDA